MRSVSLLFLVIVAFIGSSSAQIKTSDKAVIKTPTVQCDNCRDYIEFTLSHEYGVTSVKVDIKKKTTTVTWLTDRTTLENIKVAIANIGYDADDIEAEPSAWRGLPAECKKHIPKPKATVN
jgi:mercuric ion binding protein